MRSFAISMPGPVCVEAHSRLSSSSPAIYRCPSLSRAADLAKGPQEKGIVMTRKDHLEEVCGLVSRQLVGDVLELMYQRMSEDDLRRLARVVLKAAGHKSRQASRARRDLFCPGDKAMLQDKPGKTGAGMEVIVSKVMRTRTRILLPNGMTRTVPLSRLDHRS